MKNRIAWLDLFRGLAAVLVVLFHYRTYLGIKGIEFGFLAVDGFFVLSGIVLAMKYTDAIAAGMSFRSFAAARLKRLYPMAFLAAAFILWLNLEDVPSNPYIWAVPAGAWHMLVPLVPDVGGLTISTDAAFPADSPAWSLWAELVANVIWFAVIRTGKRWMPWLGGAAMLALAALAWQHGTLNTGWENALDIRAFSLVRALAWFSVGYGIARTDAKPIASPLVLTIALAGVFVAFACGVPVSWYASLATVAVSAALLHALYAAPAPAPLVGEAATWLGMASYPLYLIHGPAGRLLPHFGDVLPHAVVLLLVLVPITAIATALNEGAVRSLHAWGRKPAAQSPAAP